MSKRLIVKAEKGKKAPGWFMKTLMHGAMNGDVASGGGTPWFNTATGYKQDENGNVYQDSKVWEDDAPEAELRKGLALIGAAPIAGEALPVVAEAGLNAMNTLFTPSSWTNIYGLKILGNTAGRIADAAVLAGFAAEGAKGLYDQKQEGTLSLKNPQTYINAAMTIPVAARAAELGVKGLGKAAKAGAKGIEKVNQAISNRATFKKYDLTGTYNTNQELVDKVKQLYPNSYVYPTNDLLAINSDLFYSGVPFLVNTDPAGKFVVKRLPLSTNFRDVAPLDVENPTSIAQGVFNTPFRAKYIKEMKGLDDNSLLRLYLSSIGEPVAYPLNVSGYFRTLSLDDITEAAGKLLTKRLGFDFSDPVNNYDKIAKYIRFNPNSPYVKSGSQYQLPGDVGHLYWTQGSDYGVEGVEKARLAGLKLIEEIPSGSAVTELNKSPESWMYLLTRTLRNYGTEPGQRSFQFIKDANGNYAIGQRNTMQKTHLDRPKLLQAFKEQGGDPKVMEDYLNKFYRNFTTPHESRNPKLDLFIELQLNLTDDIDLGRMNKYIQMTREKLGLKDLPDAKIRNRLGRMLLFLTRNSYTPQIESFDFYSIMHKKGGRLIPRRK